MPVKAPFAMPLSRRAMLGTAAAALATPALAQQCQLGPPPHHKGPKLFPDYDQLELDASCDQDTTSPWAGRAYARLASDSDLVRSRIGTPRRVAYGPTEIEKLDIYRTDRPKAPIFVFIHGGSWLSGNAAEAGYAAEMFVRAGAHYVAPDFASVKDLGGDLVAMATQVRRAVAWVYKNPASFDGDPERIYVSGHSSGGHLCGVTEVTDWEKELGLPPTVVEVAFHRRHVRHDGMAQQRSEFQRCDGGRHECGAPHRQAVGARHDRLRHLETPDFQRQSRSFAAAVRTAGKPVELIAAKNYRHAVMAESVGSHAGRRRGARHDEAWAAVVLARKIKRGELPAAR